jgi:hypothetical protein
MRDYHGGTEARRGRRGNDQLTDGGPCATGELSGGSARPPFGEEQGLGSVGAKLFIDASIGA